MISTTHSHTTGYFRLLNDKVKDNDVDNEDLLIECLTVGYMITFVAEITTDGVFQNKKISPI